MSSTLPSRLDTHVVRWIAAYAIPAEAAALYRIAFVVLVVVFQGPPTYAWLGGMPDVFFRPPPFSVATIAGGWPAPWLLMVLTIFVAILYVAVLFGYRTRWSSLMLGAALLVGNSFTYTFGKINHDETLLTLVPVVMAFSNWGDAYSLDARAGRRSDGAPGWPIAMLALLLGFAMFTAAVPKVWGGWLDPSSQAVRGHLLQRFHAVGIDDYLAPVLVSASLPVWMWELFDYAAVLFEATFFAAVFRPRVLRWYVSCAIAFHLINLLMLNISFTSNLFLYLLFMDWRVATEWSRRPSVQRALSAMMRPQALWLTMLGLVTFVVTRLYLTPTLSENGLRSATNQEAPEVASLWNGVERLIGVRIDVNLVLMALATAVVVWSGCVSTRRVSGRPGGRAFSDSHGDSSVDRVT